MASWIMFGVLLILLKTNTISSTCTDVFFDDGGQNVSLIFSFVWETNETKHVRCLHDAETIGECYRLFEFECPLEPTSKGVYNMSTNVDLSVVNVTIITFNSTTSGNYSCFKYPGTPNITKCAKYSSILPSNTKSATGDSTEVCTTSRSVVGGIGAFWFLIDLVLVMLLLGFDIWDNQLLNDCCTKTRCRTLFSTRCWTIFSFVLGLCIVVFAMGIVEIPNPCEEGVLHISHHAANADERQ